MVTIRPVQADDLPFLWDMLWEAAAVDAGMCDRGKEAALADPLNRKYLDGWGRLGDAGVVAADETGTRLGAAWYRLFPVEAASYGFVAADIPEVAIGVAAGARGQGVGSALLGALLAIAREQGYRAVGLSVDRRNPARRLYERHGFRDAGLSAPTESSLTMIVSF